MPPKTAEKSFPTVELKADRPEKIDRDNHAKTVEAKPLDALKYLVKTHRVNKIRE